jgi:alkylation response protein AidB-like acyl-CoA dehydrogenase
VRQLVDNEAIPIAEEYDHEDKFPEAVVEQMKELGLYCVTIPEGYGGMGSISPPPRMATGQLRAPFSLSEAIQLKLADRKPRPRPRAS